MFVDEAGKNLPGTNPLAYNENLKITDKKSVITLAPGVNIIKHFFSLRLIYTMEKIALSWSILKKSVFKTH